jgi:hypothetical protein
MRMVVALLSIFAPMGASAEVKVSGEARMGTLNSNCPIPTYTTQNEQMPGCNWIIEPLNIVWDRIDGFRFDESKAFGIGHPMLDPHFAPAPLVLGAFD